MTGRLTFDIRVFRDMVYGMPKLNKYAGHSVYSGSEVITMKHGLLQGQCRGWPLVAGALIASLGASCIRTESKVDVRPIEIKPIYITMDVNIKVDRELDKFFDDLDSPAAPTATEKK